MAIVLGKAIAKIIALQPLGTLAERAPAGRVGRGPGVPPCQASSRIGPSDHNPTLSPLTDHHPEHPPDSRRQQHRRRPPEHHPKDRTQHRRTTGARPEQSQQRQE